MRWMFSVAFHFQKWDSFIENYSVCNGGYYCLPISISSTEEKKKSAF